MAALFNAAGSYAAWTFSNGNKTARNSSNSGNQRTAVSDAPRSSGKLYFEVVIGERAGGGAAGVAVGGSSGVVTGAAGGPSNAYEYASDGRKRSNNSLTTYGTSWTTGDIIGVAVDLTNGAIWFSKNGAWQGGADITEIGGDDTTNAAYTFTPSGAYLIRVSGIDGGAEEDELTLATTAAELTYTVPSGYEAGWPALGTADGTVALPLEIAGSARVLPLRVDGAIELPLSAAGVVSTPGHSSGGVAFPLSVAGTASVTPTHTNASIVFQLGVSGSARVGFIGSIDPTVAVLGDVEAALAGYAEFTGIASATMAGPESALYATMAFSGAIDAALGTLGASLHGYREFVGVIDADLGTLAASLAGIMPYEGTIDASLGTLRSRLVGLVDVEGGFRVVVVNLRHGAVTEYESMAFNSLIEWDGVYYGASVDGIFTLTGDDDDGTAIAGYARTGITDHGTEVTKRETDAYVSGDSAKKMVLTVMIDDGATEYDYPVPMQYADAFDAVKATLGRGLRKRYRQYELANTEGADFEVDRLDIEVRPIEQRRKR